jgi:hypothetical protein
VLSNSEVENYGVLGRHGSLLPWRQMQKIPHNLPIYKTTWRHIKTYLNLITHHLENLKFEI